MTGTAVETYLAAVADPDPGRLEALEPWLAENVVVAGPVGPGAGRELVLQSLSAPNATRLVTGAAWSDPAEVDGEVVVDAVLPAGMALGGLRFALKVGPDGRITRIEQQLLTAAPPGPQPLSISSETAALIEGALTNGTPFIVSYVDAAGMPHISPRGSVLVLNELQLGMWARDPEGGLLKGIAANPNVALYYRDPKNRVSFTISGRARVTDDLPTREAIYTRQPAIERNFDGRKRGMAIVVDVVQFDAAAPSGRTRMVRQLDED